MTTFQALSLNIYNNPMTEILYNHHFIDEDYEGFGKVRDSGDMFKTLGEQRVVGSLEKWGVAIR